MSKILCEKVCVSDDGHDNSWLVQYEDTPQGLLEKKSCLAYLWDCGFKITTEPHRVVGPGDDPAVTWGDLSDILAERDQ